MKDKYKETIYNLVHLSKAKMEDDGVFIDRKKLQEDINVLWELYNKYQELVDKATPKKVCHTVAPHPTMDSEQEFDYFYCPNCEEYLDERFINEYCSICGQKLDWSDEDE